jgi:hypothetical protein
MTQDDNDFVEWCEALISSPPAFLLGIIDMPLYDADRLLRLAQCHAVAAGLRDRRPQFDTLSGRPAQWRALIDEVRRLSETGGDLRLAGLNQNVR